MQRMGIDIISSRQSIGVFIPFSNTVPTRNKINRPSRNFAKTNNNQDTSFFHKTFLFFILLAAGIYFLYLLQQNAYPISRSIEAYNYDSCLTLKQENNSVTFTY